jgi:hypothetical protein
MGFGSLIKNCCGSEASNPKIHEGKFGQGEKRNATFPLPDPAFFLNISR